MIPELSSSGIPEDQAQILAQLLGVTVEKFKQILLHPPGSSEASQGFYMARAASQAAQIADILRQFNFGVADWLSAKTDPQTGKVTEASPIVKAAADARKRADKQAADMGVRPKDSPLEGSFNLVDTRAVQVCVKQIAADMGKAQASLKGRSDRIIRATSQLKLSEVQINKVIATGIIEGQPRHTIQQLTEDFQAVHGDRVQLIDKNGDPREMGARDYARLVVRTSTREAVETARHERLVENGLDLVSIIGRVSRYFCTAFLGQVFSISGTSDKYPALASLPGGGPPFHPNCSKSTRPFIDYLATKKQLTLADGLTDAQNLIGMNTSQAQRAFKDLQLHEQVHGSYVKSLK